MEPEIKPQYISPATVRMVFDAVLALVVASVGFIVVDVKNDIESMQAKSTAQELAIAQIRERLPIEYVRMEQYIRDRAEIRESLMRIEALLREHSNGNGVRIPQRFNSGHP